MRHRLGMLLATLSLSACVTSSGWVQEGKSEQDQKRDNGECRAQANQTCNPQGGFFCINPAYANCMEGRGWHKEG